MFKFLSDISTGEVITGIHRAVRFLRHWAVMQDVNRDRSSTESSLEAYQGAGEIASEILKEIYNVEGISLTSRPSEAITDVYINNLADIAQNTVWKELNYDLERGQHLLNELRQFRVGSTLSSRLGISELTLHAKAQRVIANVWQDVLKVERIDIHSNFFDLGGDSLLLTLAHRRLKRDLGIDLSLRDMYTHPTISSLATHLIQAHQELTPQIKDGRVTSDTNEPSLVVSTPVTSGIADLDNSLQWYLVQTHPKQEYRAQVNLKAWQIETFTPKLRQSRLDPFTGKMVESIHPLFPRYIFACFRANELLHKVTFTRGVYTVVNFANNPVVVGNNIITLIKSRVDEEGFVKLDDHPQLYSEFEGLEPIRNLILVFNPTLKASDRVHLLLKTLIDQVQVALDDKIKSITPKR